MTTYHPNIVNQPMRLARRAVLLVVIALAVPSLAGCAGLAGGVVLDAAVPAIDKTTALINAGKCEAYEPVPMEEAVTIVRRAAEKLALTHVSEQTCDGRLKLTYKDMRKQKIEIEIVPRTTAVTAILIDVGWFGKSGMGTVALRQILHDMPARLETHF